jgi:hypothetical protein
MLAGQLMKRYSQTHTKAAKSAVVTEIIAVIRQAGGNFCKYDDERGAWFEVGEASAREKVSALLRDLLYTQYRSSAKAKVDRRRKTVVHKQVQNQLSEEKRVEGTGDSDDSSTSSSCWAKSFGIDHSLEDSEDFFVIDVF